MGTSSTPAGGTSSTFCARTFSVASAIGTVTEPSLPCIHYRRSMRGTMLGSAMPSSPAACKSAAYPTAAFRVNLCPRVHLPCPLLQLDPTSHGRDEGVDIVALVDDALGHHCRTRGVLFPEAGN